MALVFMGKKPTIILAVILLVVGASFLLRGDNNNEGENNFLEDLFSNEESPKEDQKNIENNQKIPVYEGRPLDEIRIGEGFSGTNEVVEIQKKNLAEHIAEISANPENVDAWVGIGVIKKFFNDYEGARDVWEYTTLRFPNHPIAFSNLGSLYGFYLGESNQAVGNYRNAINLEPFNPLYYLGLAEFYKESGYGNQEEIISLLKEGMREAPLDVNLPLFTAYYYKEIGDKENAIKYFEEVLAKSPEHEGIKEEIESLKSGI